MTVDAPPPPPHPPPPPPHLPPPELPPGLVAEYLESARSQLGVLAGLAERLVVAASDCEAIDALRRETHKVHGSAGSYGFMEASRLAAGMEATVKDWAARPDEPDVERGSLARWFVKRLRSEEHTSELQSRSDLVCRLLLEKKKVIVEFTVLANAVKYAIVLFLYIQ